MSGAGARAGVGTRLRYDGETVEAVQMAATTAGNEVVLKDGPGRSAAAVARGIAVLRPVRRHP